MPAKLWVSGISGVARWAAIHPAVLRSLTTCRRNHGYGRVQAEDTQWMEKLLVSSEGGGYDLSKAGIVGQSVAWGDQDLFCHVNNVVYLKWFETARVNLFYNVADQYPEMLELFKPANGTSCVIRSAELAWRRSIVYPDRITVVHKVGPLRDPDRFVLQGVVISHNQKVVAARIKEVLVCIDQQGKKAPIPPRVKEIMELWIKEQDKHNAQR